LFTASSGGRADALLASMYRLSVFPIRARYRNPASPDESRSQEMREIKVSTIPIPRQRLSVLAVATVFSVFAVLLLATPAQALGDNRTVERGCGKNYVASGHNGSAAEGHSWAQTTRQSGDCRGRLSAALERRDGYWSNRVYGTRQEAYATARFQDIAKHGLHWGCDNCNVTRS